MSAEVAERKVLVAPADLVVIDLASAVIGLSRRAIEGKIHEGMWLEGREYHRAPDGRIYVSLPGFYRWVKGS